MKFKNIFRMICFAAVMMTAFSFRSSAAMAPVSTVSVMPGDSTKDAALAASIVSRVTEIDNMDKTNLSVSEKKALRKELKELKQQAEGLDSKVYLSVGAIIIIILLLILILR